MTIDSVVKAKIRAELPVEVFSRRPLRCALMIPMTAAVVTISFLVATLPLPWYLALLAALVLGNFYGSMMFLAHEIGHGATVRSRRLQRVFMYPGCAIFLISPYFWIIWHNQSHHGHTNRPDEDPDNFGTSEKFRTRSRSSRAILKFAPGSGYLRSVLYLFTFFTLHSQHVLWSRSKKLPGYENLDRRHAVADSTVMGAFWITIGISMGARAAVFVVIIPMLVANFVLLSYIVTNHMVRPLSYRNDILGTTMSVKTIGLLDKIHFNFSHHVEHHLFPAMASSMTPSVRGVLKTYFDQDYLAPPHWLALITVLRTPRLYDGLVALADPYHSYRVEIPEVERHLRGEGPRPDKRFASFQTS